MRDANPSTTDLHAYVDNELGAEQRDSIAKAIESDPQLQAEIDAIKALKTDIASAFSHIPNSDTSLDVPERSSVTELPIQSKKWRGLYWAAAACLVMGITGGYLLGQSSNGAAPTQDWIAQVVNYQGMYSTDTLAHVAPSPEQHEQLLQRLSAALSHNVIIPDFSVQSIEFKRGQILTSQQKPVIQLAFLDTATGMPIALCITPSADSPKEFADGNSHGVNYVNWRSDKLDFLVVGNISHEQLNVLAKDAELQFSKSRSS